ncbi:MAG: hypothetical protein CVT92_08085 [Bacteroidetes bacterium HGW-Bacteroidetes-1]|nr:MAG: hypothetical protein CVT92_08085 [Bacteroidetes bacterium HGW-Bacteroidetes-1]
MQVNFLKHNNAMRKSMFFLFIILLLFSITTSIISCRMNKMIVTETDAILSKTQYTNLKVITDEDIQQLPSPVRKWLKTTGIIGNPEIKSVYVKQQAQMKMKPNQKKWHKAEAIQYVTTENPAFIWSVKMNMSPLIRIKGRDKYVDGKGEMLIKMNGLINVVNEKGEKLDEGTLQRYLGELVWYPSAALSPYIRWEAIDESSAKATMSYKGTTGSGVFFFNEQGDFVKFSAMRFQGNEPDAKRYEWIVSVNDYAIFDKIKVPAQMEATWKLKEGDWTWLKLNITELKYNVTRQK